MVKIKEWRQGLGITQKALADAAGLIFAGFRNWKPVILIFKTLQ